jgi:branched-chain amino acid transport system permease protein
MKSTTVFAPDRSIPLLVSTIIFAILAYVAVRASNAIPSYFVTPLVLAFFAHVYFATSLKVSRAVQIAVFIIVLAIGVPLIGITNSLYLQVVVITCVFAAMALGLNVVVGFAGLLDLGYAAFFAVGAYLWAIFGSTQANNFTGGGFPLNGNWMFVFIPLAIVVAAGFGALLGIPVLKVKGDYLAIITLGLGEVIRVLANNLNKPINITNGSQGVRIPPDPETSPLAFLTIPLSNLTQLPLFQIQLLMYYVLGLIIIAAVVLFTTRLDNSRIGRAWVAIREDEIAAQAMGVPLVSTKLIAFATGASFAGAMGVLYAAIIGFISPSDFNFAVSTSILAMVVLGGLGSIRGVIVGAAIVIVLNQLLLKEISDVLLRVVNLPPRFDPTQYQQLIYGIILIVMMILRPKGLVPAKRNPAHLEDLEHGELAKGAK